MFLSARNSVLNPVQETEHFSHFSMCSQNSLFELFQSPTRGSTWNLQNNKQVQVDRLSRSSLYVTYSGWPATFNRCHWVDKLLTPCVHLEYAHLSILTGEKFYHSTKMPLTTSNILITTSANSPPFRFSFAALHFVRVLSIAKNSSLHLLTNFHQVLNKSLTVPWAKRHIISNLRY